MALMDALSLIRRLFGHPTEPFSQLILVPYAFSIASLDASSILLPAIDPHFPLQRTPLPLETHAFLRKLSNRVFQQAVTFSEDQEV